MKNRSLRILSSLLLGICLCTSAVASTTLAQADIAARNALELKQYSDVVKAYSGFDAKALSDQSYYRLAISHQKLGNALDAQKALDLALGLNPKGTFASTPERLALLKADIAKIAPTPKKSEAEKIVPPQADALGASSETISANAAPVSSESIFQYQPAPANLPANFSAAEKKTVALQAQLKVKEATVIWVSVINVVVGLIFLATVVFGWYRLKAEKDTNSQLKQKFSALQTTTSRPPTDVQNLVNLRDAVTTMRKLTTATGADPSALLKALEKLEPLVVMEIGRNHFRSTGKPGDLAPEDRVMLKSIKQLEVAPMALRGAEPADILRFLFGGRERFAQSTGVGVQTRPGIAQ